MNKFNGPVDLMYSFNPLNQFMTFTGYFQIATKRSHIYWNWGFKLFTVIMGIYHSYYFNWGPAIFELILIDFFRVLSYTMLLHSIVESCIYGKRIKNILKVMNNVDFLLRKIFKKKIDYRIPRKRLFIIISTWYIILLLSYIAGALTEYLDDKTNFAFGPSHLYYLNSVYNGNTNFLLMFILSELKRRLTIMHSTTTTISAVNPKKTLKFSKEVHNLIWKVAQETNLIFETSLTLKFLLSLLYVIFGCFWGSKGEFMGLAIPYSRYGMNIVILVISTIDITIIVYDFASFADKAKETVRILQDLENTVGTSNLEYLQVELFALQVYVDDFKFSLFGCVPLDWTLLHSMMAAVASYLVIFHQFSALENRTL